MNTLQDMGDRQSRLSAIDLFYSLTNGRAKEFLVEIKDREQDPVVLAKIDDLLSREDKSE
jgi:hypothetical protein